MVDENPIISVLIPSLNSEDYINRCLESVVNQTLRNIEIICIDAGSTDKTLEILEDYAKKDSRIKIAISSKRSYGYQMNLGLNLANGQYIAIVESDDFIAEDMYEELYSLTNDGTIDVVKTTSPVCPFTELTAPPVECWYGSCSIKISISSFSVSIIPPFH